MIIVRLIGGLGNQLFQYAVGRRLAHDRRLPLKLDISGFDTYTLHAYGLQRFSMRPEIAKPDEVSAFVNRRFGRLRNLVPFRHRSVVIERHFHFDPDVLRTTRRNIYLDGYWQSEKYFDAIGDILRDELKVAEAPDEANRRMAREIINANAVSLHIRRGDYVSNSETRDFHGVVPLSYYRDSAAEIAGEVAGAHFFIFSDDPEWVSQHLELAHPMTIVRHNGADRNYEDLRLMSLCRHHVIANSSFSWWGAWLGTNEGKIVIAPSKWLNDPRLKTDDVIPAEWRRR
jgi:hypothetical protein